MRHVIKDAPKKEQEKLCEWFLEEDCGDVQLKCRIGRREWCVLELRDSIRRVHYIDNNSGLDLDCGRIKMRGE